MEVKFDVVKPNVLVLGNEIYFGMDNSDIIPVSMHIEETIRKHIGVLKVRESDLDVLKTGSSKTMKEFTIPLKDYLKAVEEQNTSRYRSEIAGVTYELARLFGLSYKINAVTFSDRQSLEDWIELKRNLEEPDVAFNIYEQNNPFLKLDRERTLQEMQRQYNVLDPNIPENHAIFNVVHGLVPYNEEELLESKKLGFVVLAQLKSKDKAKIDEAKSGLIERLKEVDGPCLSFDAPAIFRQMQKLYWDAPKLIERYGDVLKSPSWKTRLFRLDP